MHATDQLLSLPLESPPLQPQAGAQQACSLSVRLEARTDHPRLQWHDSWRVTRLQPPGYQPQVLEQAAGHAGYGARLISDGGAGMPPEGTGQHLPPGVGSIPGSNRPKRGRASLPGALALAGQPAPLTALQNLTLNVQKQALRSAAEKAAPVCLVGHGFKRRHT